MPRLSALLFRTAAALLMGTAAAAVVPAGAGAAVHIDFGFHYFQDRLGAQGRWIYNPIWGEVWQPRRRLVGAGFQPYTNGYWQFTAEYGWYWVSYDPFDDLVYHYGRWVFDPAQGWLWLPGYTWGPGWVIWREGGGYSGWMPMPPDETFISGSGLSLGLNFGSWGVNFYGYNRWYGGRVDPSRFWIFVSNRDLADRDYRKFVVPRDRAKSLIAGTRNVTRFEVVNNRVVNRSLDVKAIERAAGRRIAPVPAKSVIKPNAVVMTVDESRTIRQRERAQHPIRENPFRENAGSGPAGGGSAPGTGREPGERDKASGRTGGAMAGPPAGSAAGQSGQPGAASGEMRGVPGREPPTPAGSPGQGTAPAPRGSMPPRPGGTEAVTPEREERAPRNGGMSGAGTTGPAGSESPRGAPAMPGGVSPGAAGGEKASRAPRNITPGARAMPRSGSGGAQNAPMGAPAGGDATPPRAAKGNPPEEATPPSPKRKSKQEQPESESPR
jgi:hypothetical protein